MFHACQLRHYIAHCESLSRSSFFLKKKKKHFDFFISYAVLFLPCSSLSLSFFYLYQPGHERVVPCLQDPGRQAREHLCLQWGGQEQGVCATGAARDARAVGRAHLLRGQPQNHFVREALCFVLFFVPLGSELLSFFFECVIFLESAIN